MATLTLLKPSMIISTFTFKDAEFMSIVLTVTWLSVQTPTTCIIGV